MCAWLPVLDSISVYVMAVIFIATLIRSTLGFGEALVAVPLLALRIPVAVAAPLAVLVSIIVAGLIVAQDWRHVQIKSATGLIASAIPGIPLGLLLLACVEDHIVKLILGVIIVAFSLYSLAAPKNFQLKKDHLGWLLGAGFCSGILGGAYGMNGPPLAIYGALRGWSPQHFRATLQGYFLPASLAGMIGYIALGMWTTEVSRFFLLSLPGVLIAIVAGRFIHHRLQGGGFYSWVHAGLLLIGVTLLVEAIPAL
jgi:hypothetical protein